MFSTCLRVYYVSTCFVEFLLRVYELDTCSLRVYVIVMYVLRFYELILCVFGCYVSASARLHCSFPEKSEPKHLWPGSS